MTNFLPQTVLESGFDADQNIAGLIQAGSHLGRATKVGMPLLHHLTMRAQDIAARRAFAKAKDLISLVLGHRPGADIGSGAARVVVAIACVTPAGKSAVEIRFK